MEQYFISGRAAIDDAIALIEEFGPDAPLAAAMRAERSREIGNLRKFCHWRQIERFAGLLAGEHVEGAIH